MKNGLLTWPHGGLQSRRWLAISVAVALALAIGWASSAARAQDGADDWQWSLTPYLWLPTIDGKLNYELPPGGGGAPEVSIGPTDWLELLNFGALVAASATKDRFAVFTDLMYLSMSSDSDGRLLSVEGTISGPGGNIEIPVGAEVNVDTESEFDGFLWMLAGGYMFADSEAATHYVFAGFRLLTADFSTDWSLSGAITGPGGETILASQGSIGKGVDLWDGIVGVKGRFNLGEGKWFLPYSADIGTGDSDLVWSVTMSLAREYGWGDLVLGYRHLEYDEGAGGVLQDFSLSGPGFGGNFHF